MEEHEEEEEEEENGREKDSGNVVRTSDETADGISGTVAQTGEKKTTLDSVSDAKKKNKTHTHNSPWQRNSHATTQ